jgi:hypothetical protein
MSRNQIDALIIVVGLLAEAGAFFALNALGASERLVILGALVCMMLTCLAVGEHSAHHIRKERRQRR